MVKEFGLTNCEKMLDRVLNSLVDFSFMQNAFKSFENGVYTCRGQLREDLPHFYHEIAGDINRILCGVLQEKGQKLQAGEIGQNLLIYEMSNHFSCSHTNNLSRKLTRNNRFYPVIPLIRLLKL